MSFAINFSYLLTSTTTESSSSSTPKVPPPPPSHSSTPPSSSQEQQQPPSSSSSNSSFFSVASSFSKTTTENSTLLSDSELDSSSPSSRLLVATLVPSTLQVSSVLSPPVSPQSEKNNCLKFDEPATGDVTIPTSATSNNHENPRASGSTSRENVLARTAFAAYIIHSETRGENDRGHHAGGKKKFTVYKILVTFGAKQWCIHRRYNDFHRLHDSLSKCQPTTCRKLPTFPPKRLLGNNLSREFVRARCSRLNAWIGALVDEPTFAQEPAMKRFFQPRPGLDPHHHHHAKQHHSQKQTDELPCFNQGDTASPTLSPSLILPSPTSSGSSFISVGPPNRTPTEIPCSPYMPTFSTASAPVFIPVSPTYSASLSASASSTSSATTGGFFLGSTFQPTFATSLTSEPVDMFHGNGSSTLHGVLNEATTPPVEVLLQFPPMRLSPSNFASPSPSVSSNTITSNLPLKINDNMDVVPNARAPDEIGMECCCYGSGSCPKEICEFDPSCPECQHEKSLLLNLSESSQEQGSKKNKKKLRVVTGRSVSRRTSSSVAVLPKDGEYQSLAQMMGSVGFEEDNEEPDPKDAKKAEKMKKKLRKKEEKKLEAEGTERKKKERKVKNPKKSKISIASEDKENACELEGGTSTPAGTTRKKRITAVLRRGTTTLSQLTSPTSPSVHHVADHAGEKGDKEIRNEKRKEKQKKREKEKENKREMKKEKPAAKGKSITSSAEAPVPGYVKKVSLRDFVLLKVIGKGSYGKVMLARHKATEEIVAIKVLSKRHLRQKPNGIGRVMSERNVLKQSTAHPFLVGLRYSFQTKEKLYLVIDYVNGGELYFHLARDHRFPEPRARFYAAEITIALEHMHERRLIYRDLKPENCLLDAEGHIRLVDFGLTKQLGVSSIDGDGTGAGGCGTNADYDAKTRTFCGTPEYLAPEILGQQPYGKAVDWYCLGAVLYEMLVGLPPFYSPVSSEMYDRILHDDVQFPPDVSPIARSFIFRLLDRDPERRLGAGPDGAEQVKSHPFFEGVDWGKVLRREYQPPFDPGVNDALDLKNIDPAFVSEPIPQSLLDDTPDSPIKKSPSASSLFNPFSYYRSSPNCRPSSQYSMDDTAFQGFSFTPDTVEAMEAEGLVEPADDGPADDGEEESEGKEGEVEEDGESESESEGDEDEDEDEGGDEDADVPASPYSDDSDGESESEVEVAEEEQ